MDPFQSLLQYTVQYMYLSNTYKYTGCKGKLFGTNLLWLTCMDYHVPTIHMYVLVVQIVNNLTL